MKQCLLIKTSSLGDIIHTLPALTDAWRATGGIRFDWVVEEAFSEIPAWHQAVRTVIPIALRRWRRQITHTMHSGAWKEFMGQLQHPHYDMVIDAQGLLKSAFIARLARGATYGPDRKSAREPLAAWFYRHKTAVPTHMHAVERNRYFLAKIFGYEVSGPVEYGIDASFPACEKRDGTILFFHGTTWRTKLWPDSYWLRLADQLTADGHAIALPWGNETEKKRADNIRRQARHPERVMVLARLSLRDLACRIRQAAGVVAVDSGLAHLAAAMNTPAVSIFGPTRPGLTRPYGLNQICLQVGTPCQGCLRKRCGKPAPAHGPETENITPVCYETVPPEKVKNALYSLVHPRRQER